MPDFVAFNSGCHSLMSADTCAAASDVDSDGTSDQVSLTFRGNDGQNYTISATAPAWSGEWREGTLVELAHQGTDGQARLLARFELDAQRQPLPQDIGDGICQSSPSMNAPDGPGQPYTLTLPDGEHLKLEAGDDATYRGEPRNWVYLRVGAERGNSRFELATEGVYAPNYDEGALITERGKDGVLRELEFVAAERLAPPQ